MNPKPNTYNLHIEFSSELPLAFVVGAFKAVLDAMRLLFPTTRVTVDPAGAGQAFAEQLDAYVAERTACHIPQGFAAQLAARDAQILQAFNGTNQAELAERFGTTPNAIYQIIRRAEYQHLRAATQAVLSQAWGSPVEALWAGRLATLGGQLGNSTASLAVRTAIAAGLPDHAPAVLVVLPPGHPASVLPTNPGSPSTAPAETPPGTQGHAGEPPAPDAAP
ncbi:Mor transcription activator family protein [Pseudomonas aeruginosa]